MRAIVSWVLLCVCTLHSSVLQLSDAEQAYLQKKREIRMCIDPNWMPYEKIEKGRHIGITRDYMALFSERIGVPIRLIPTIDWSQSLEYAKSRKCDIFSLAMATPERRSYMNFTSPYLSIPLVVATRLDELFIVDISEVEKKPLGVVKGYAFAELLRLKYPHMNIVDVPSIDVGLDGVARGELFGFIGTLSSIGYAIQRRYIGELKVAGKFDDTWELGVGVRNDDPMLLSIFEQAVLSLDYETGQEIMNRWISVRYERGFDYDLLWKLLLVGGIVALFFIYRHYQLIRYNRMLHQLSVTDSLTGLYNRIRIDGAIQTQIDSFERYGLSFSILLIDIDRFKHVNDTYGHQAGDQMLVVLAELLQSTIRKTDVAGRWGGEEFVVVLPYTGLEGAVDSAEKIRQKVAEYDAFEGHRVTVSIGVAQMRDSDNFTTLLKRADDALYQAKENGRNRVEHIVVEEEEVISFTEGE